MKTWLKWLLGIVASLSAIIGIGVLNQMNKQEQLKQEMVKVVESEEAKDEFEEVLKNLDSKALTVEGKIRSYKIDLESISHSPMGGLFVTLIINGDKQLSVTISLNNYDQSKGLQAGGVTYSSTLNKLLNGD